MVLRKTAPRFVVLGGAGAIGRIIVRDLFESHPKNKVLVADYDREAAEQIAKSYRSKRVTADFADARYPSRLAAVMIDQTVVLNCTRHQLNLNVMEAALRRGCTTLTSAACSSGRGGSSGFIVRSPKLN